MLHKNYELQKYESGQLTVEVLLDLLAVGEGFPHPADGADDVAGEQVLPGHVGHLDELEFDLFALVTFALALEELVAHDHLQEARLLADDLN